MNDQLDLIYRDKYSEEEANYRRKMKALVDGKWKYYLGKPVEEWPQIAINWDLNPDRYQFALDGESREQFNESYPKGVLAGEVIFSKLDEVLCAYAHRTMEELWSVGFQHKLATLLAHVELHHPLTPIFIRPDAHHPDQIFLTGGHHRYALCKGRKEATIPILCATEDKAEIDKMLNVTWLTNNLGKNQ